jgi:hypothetical protein
MDGIHNITADWDIIESWNKEEFLSKLNEYIKEDGSSIVLETLKCQIDQGKLHYSVFVCRLSQ